MKHAFSLTLLILFTVAGCATHEHVHNADHTNSPHNHHDGSVSSSDSNPTPEQSLQNNWIVTSIAGEAVAQQDDTPVPRLELNVTDKRVIGFDGCNNFQGSIASVDASALTFGPLMATRMFCPEMNIPDTFNQNLHLVKGYKREAQVLRLLDEEGNTLMELKKVD